MLPKATADAWSRLAPLVPVSAYLAGGTALALRLGHRSSRDLDFLFDGGVNLDRLVESLASAGTISVSHRDEGTINATFESTRIQFLDVSGQTVVRPGDALDGVAIASLEDVAAMKVKAVLDRGELRDYFDLMTLDTHGVPAVDAIGHFAVRFGVPFEDQRIGMVVRSLGYLDDVVDDPGLPVPRADIERFWHRRSAEVARNLSRW